MVLGSGTHNKSKFVNNGPIFQEKIPNNEYPILPYRWVPCCLEVQAAHP